MLNISFDFNETTQTVSNLKVKSYNQVAANYDMLVEENKLVFTPSAVEKLRAVAGDRISVNYWTADSSHTYPIVSKSDFFTDGTDGTKLTKSNTVSFRGQQRNTLLKFGSLFLFEEWKDRNGEVKEGVFILVPVKEDTETEIANKTEEELLEINNAEIEDDLADILEDDDVLPF